MDTKTESIIKVPDWIVDYITEWKTRLCLCEWETRTKLTDRPGGDDENLASVMFNIDALIAEIDIRADVPDDLSQVDSITAIDWKRAIAHELLHIRFGRVDHMVLELFDELLPTNTRPILNAAFRREIEPVIQIMASVLCSLAEESDDRSPDNQAN